MRCGEAKRLMQMALAGDATSTNRHNLDQHIGACPNCAALWREMNSCAEAVHAATPAALAIERDLASGVLERLGASRSNDTSRTRRLPSFTVRAAALVIIAALAVWFVTRPQHRNSLLSIVEAAAAVPATHSVQSLTDASGREVLRTEVWRWSNGNSYVATEDLAEGVHAIWMFRKAWNIAWTHVVGTNEYKLLWHQAVHVDYEQRIRQRMTQLDLHLPDACGSVSGPVLALLREPAVGTLKINSTTGEFNGQKVTIFSVDARLPEVRDASIASTSRHMQSLRIEYFLTRNLSQLVRAKLVFYDENGEPQWTAETWPIEYDVTPPATLQTQIPRDETIIFNAGSISHHWEDIDPLWEYMDDAERQEITDRVLALADAWQAGDFEQFAKYYDFHAGLEYGVKGKFTAEEIREHWKGMVARQKGRWADYQLTVDYGFRSAAAPPMALGFFSIYRQNPQSGAGWHLYRQEPTQEPGLVVLARVSVTHKNGETQQLRTQLFLKKLQGEYKVILWRPPFAP